MSQILIDNAARGTTSLLATCVPAATSSQLLDGSAVGDGTGDTGFNAARKLKQWAADINANTALILGNYLAAVPAAGQTNNWDPTGGATGGLLAVSRLDINPSAGNAVITGLLATALTDEKSITIRNISTSNLVTLSHQNTSSSAANQFYGPGEDLILNPGMAVKAVYYLIISGPNYWVLLP